MAAKAVHVAAGPLERPTTPSMFALLGVTSNCASKEPPWAAIALFCQAPALVRQLGAVTAIAAVPLFPSLVAVMVTLPVATPVTSPPVDTAATPGALDAHVTVRPASTFPFASLSSAVSCCVDPTDTLAEAGLTVTEATGRGFTVTAALAVFPALVAVIVTAPAATPVTSPVDDTVATAGALDAQVTDRPESTLPAESSTVAASCTVAPASTTAVTGLTVTEATGTGFTVTVARPVIPSLVALIVAVPAATPVTRPPVDTVATPRALDAHVTVRPLSGLPFASFGVAVSCTVCPTITLGDAGLMLTDATGTGFTVTAALPVFPSLVAVIVTALAATPVTSPVEDTVATAGALDAQVTDRPDSTLPAESFSVAASCTVAPTSTTAVAGLITTDATGTFATLIAADALFPSLVAVIVAVPAATPVTRPAADALAMAGFELESCHRQRV